MQAHCAETDKSSLCSSNMPVSLVAPAQAWPTSTQPPSATGEPCLAKPFSTHQSERKRRIDDLMHSVMDLSSQSTSIAAAPASQHM